MAGGPATLQIGALSSLGFVKQVTYGTPVTVPNNSLNWVPITARALKYATGHHLTQTGSGTRGAEQYGARGKSLVQGTFETLLFTQQSAALISYFMGGTDTKTGTGPYVHTLAWATAPQLLTFETQWAGQSYQIQDAYIDVLEVVSSKEDWKLRFTVLGSIGDTPIVSGTPTFVTTDTLPLQWGDTSAATLPGAMTIAELESISLMLKNNVQQQWGAGLYTPGQAAGGIVQASGKARFTFASAAAATAIANTAGGTEITLALTIGPVTVNSVAGCQHVITMPNTRLKDPSEVYNVGSLFMFDADLLVRVGNGATYAITNGYSTAYL